LQVAKDDWFAIPWGQVLDLFAQFLREWTFRRFPRSREAAEIGIGLLAGIPAQPVLAGPRPDAVGDAVEPVGQQRTRADCTRLACQNQERRLKGVGRVVRVGQQPPTDGVNQRPVAVEDRRKRGLVALVDETLQQDGVRLRQIRLQLLRAPDRLDGLQH
jgi:hypothetical protein